jgi:hypothetical protein
MEVGMDNAIWAIYYDLSEANRERYLNWFHEDHLPGLLSRSGYLWAAHYESVPFSNRFQKVFETLRRSNEPGQGPGKGYVVLFGAESTHTFFDPTPTQLSKSQSVEAREMIGLRVQPRSMIYAVEWRVEGPASHMREAKGTPGPAIQMGRFSLPREDEEDLGAWYAQERMPVASRMPGCLGARKLLAAAGDPKHGVLYEFSSLDARTTHFESMEKTEWTARVHRYLVHAPESPLIGRRLWPPA